MGRPCSTNGQEFIEDIGGEPEGKRPLETSRLKWSDNIEMDLREIRCCMDCVGLARDTDLQRALLNALMNLPIPYNIMKFLSSCRTIGFSRTQFRGSGQSDMDTT